ncbi:hypothetical protein FKP32DRAFT_641374 [Trametes sanguinea]|nr:hypothetical protein FKP32DRAFT_641374 [Trametes sanguinea]
MRRHGPRATTSPGDNFQKTQSALETRRILRATTRKGDQRGHSARGALNASNSKCRSRYTRKIAFEERRGCRRRHGRRCANEQRLARVQGECVMTVQHGQAGAGARAVVIASGEPREGRLGPRAPRAIVRKRAHVRSATGSCLCLCKVGGLRPTKLCATVQSSGYISTRDRSHRSLRTLPRIHFCLHALPCYAADDGVGQSVSGLMAAALRPPEDLQGPLIEGRSSTAE